MIRVAMSKGLVLIVVSVCEVLALVNRAGAIEDAQEIVREENLNAARAVDEIIAQLAQERFEELQADATIRNEKLRSAAKYQAGVLLNASERSYSWGQLHLAEGTKQKLAAIHLNQEKPANKWSEDTVQVFAEAPTSARTQLWTPGSEALAASNAELNVWRTTAMVAYETVANIYSRSKEGADYLDAASSAFWPPPAPSTHAEIPIRCNAPPVTYGKIDTRFRLALNQAGYADANYALIPGGFALVTPIERLEIDGTPKSSRWAPEVGNWFDRFFCGKKCFLENGFFRRIAFIVTRKDVVPKEAISWRYAPYLTLPMGIQDLKMPPGTKCLALVYEFEMPDNTAKQVEARRPSRLTAHQHLSKSGLSEALEKVQ